MAATYPEDVAAAAAWSRANAASQGRCRGARGRRAALGSVGQVAARVSGAAGAHGREPAMAARPRRSLPRPAGAGHGHGAGPAAARAGERSARDQRGHRGVPARRSHRRAAAHAGRLRALLRPLRRVRAVVVGSVLPPGRAGGHGRPYPVFVAHGFFYSAPDWHHRHVRVVHRPGARASPSRSTSCPAGGSTARRCIRTQAPVHRSPGARASQRRPHACSRTFACRKRSASRSCSSSSRMPAATASRARIATPQRA